MKSVVIRRVPVKKRSDVHDLSQQNKGIDKDTAVNARLEASFHGESWFRCPTCKGAFEFYQAFFNKSRCPHCGQLIKDI